MSIFHSNTFSQCANLPRYFTSLWGKGQKHVLISWINGFNNNLGVYVFWKKHYVAFNDKSQTRIINPLTGSQAKKPYWPNLQLRQNYSKAKILIIFHMKLKTIDILISDFLHPNSKWRQKFCFEDFDIRWGWKIDYLGLEKFGTTSQRLEIVIIFPWFFTVFHLLF